LRVALKRGRDHNLEPDLAARLSRPVFENAVLAAEGLRRPLIDLAGVKSIQGTLLGALASRQNEGEDQPTGAHKRHYITEGHMPATAICAISREVNRPLPDHLAALHDSADVVDGGLDVGERVALDGDQVGVVAWYGAAQVV